MAEAENFAPNSNKTREKSSLDEPQTKPEEKKITAVAAGKKVKKRTGLRELTDGFIQEDAGAVASYIWRDVLRPALKKTLRDMITGGADMFLYGDEAPKSRSGQERVSWREGRIVASEPKAERVRSSYNFDDVFYPTREEAQRAVDTLLELTDMYGTASIADLYSVSGLTGKYTDNDWGWKKPHVLAAKIMIYGDGYVLKMPKPIPLNN